MGREETGNEIVERQHFLKKRTGGREEEEEKEVREEGEEEKRTYLMFCDFCHTCLLPYMSPAIHVSGSAQGFHSEYALFLHH